MEKIIPKARELIEAELGDESFPGDRPGDMPGGRPDPRRRFPGGMRRPGGPGGPEGGPGGAAFSGRDYSLMKDIALCELVQAQRGDYYKKLVNTLISGQEPEPGQLQHFIDEAHNFPELGEQHKMLLAKIQQVLAQKNSQPPPAA
jgi:hypothetical protein